MQACVFGLSKLDDNANIRAILMQIANLQVHDEPASFGHFHTLVNDGLDLAIVNLNVIDLTTIRRIVNIAPNCNVIGISKGLDVPAIIAASRAGCSQFVSEPVTMSDLRDVIESVRASKGLQRFRRICVMGSAGGSGATTIACNLAVELSKVAGSSAILDLDLEYGNVGCALDVKSKYCLADLCSEHVDKFAVYEAVAKFGDVSVLVRPDDIRRIYEITENRLLEVLAAMGESYPYVVVDMSRPNGQLGAAAMNGADNILIVAQYDVPSVRNAVRARSIALDSGVEEINIKLVLNRCGSNGSNSTTKDIEDAYGGPVFAQIPNDWKNSRMSLDLGRPLPKSSPAGIAIRAMARELAGVPQSRIKKKRHGWLRRSTAAALA